MALGKDHNLPNLTPRSPSAKQETPRRHSISKVPTRSHLALRRTLQETSRCTRLPALENLDPNVSSEKPNSAREERERVQTNDGSQSARRPVPSNTEPFVATFNRPWLEEVQPHTRAGEAKIARGKTMKAESNTETERDRGPAILNSSGQERDRSGDEKDRKPKVPDSPKAKGPGSPAKRRLSAQAPIAGPAGGQVENNGSSSSKQFVPQPSSPVASSQGENDRSGSSRQPKRPEGRGTVTHVQPPAGMPQSPPQPLMQQPPPVPRSRSSSLASSASLQTAGSASDGADSRSSKKADNRRYHIMLLERTFNGRSKSGVAKSLEQVLGISGEDATNITEEFSDRHVTKIATYDNHSEALKKSQDLRDRGLVVQVVSESGVPGASTENLESSDNARRASFTKETSLEFEASKTVPSPAPPPMADQRRRVSANATQPPMRRRSSANATQPAMPRKTSYNEFFPEKKQPAAQMRRASMPAVSPRPPNSPMSQSADDKASAAGSSATSRPDDADARSKAFNGPPVARRRSASGIEGFKGLVSQVAKEQNSSLDRDLKSAGSDMWDSVLDDMGINRGGPRFTQQQREACMLMRIFVFGGNVGAHEMSTWDFEEIFNETIGTKQQVCMLHILWTHLDDDLSGRVDLQEFRKGAESNWEKIFRNGRDNDNLTGLKLPKMPEDLANTLPTTLMTEKDVRQFITRLCDRCASLLLGKKSSFALQDMMRLIWPSAKAPAIKVMTDWCTELIQEAKRNRVDAPPVLDQEQFDEVCSIFMHYDTEARGEIPFERLVDVGLIEQEQIDQWRQDWDADGNGKLNLKEWCDMMCPAGYRASKDSLVGSMKDGRRVCFDRWIDGWRAEKLDTISLDKVKTEAEVMLEKEAMAM